jgi:hypothetical protein
MLLAPATLPTLGIFLVLAILLVPATLVAPATGLEPAMLLVFAILLMFAMLLIFSITAIVFSFRVFWAYPINIVCEKRMVGEVGDNIISINYLGFYFSLHEGTRGISRIEFSIINK